MRFATIGGLAAAMREAAAAEEAEDRAAGRPVPEPFDGPFDDLVDLDIEACPGCGCLPGQGRTPGCAHPDGCGFDPEALAR